MAVLDTLYDAYRNDFLRWAGQRFPAAGRDDLLDAWHDTMIMFYEQVRDRKLTTITCEIKTFLFLIGYRRLIRMHKKSEKIDLPGEIDVNMQVDHSINEFTWDDEDAEKHEFLRAAVEELPEKSREILMRRFMDGQSIDEIMVGMEYSSQNAVSATLSRSLKKLKDSIIEKMALQKGWKNETRS